MSAVCAVFDPERKAREHLAAAKNYTVLKHEARSLHETFSPFLGEEELIHEVKKLLERYNKVGELTPPTTDKAFLWASKRIREGIHEPDFKSLEA